METNLKHSGTRSTEVCQREIDHAVFAREAAEITEKVYLYMPE